MFLLVFRFSFPVSQMGWEVFYQATLILIHSTELKSKREGNYNVVIMGLVDHGLHVI